MACSHLLPFLLPGTGSACFPNGHPALVCSERGWSCYSREGDLVEEGRWPRKRDDPYVVKLSEELQVDRCAMMLRRNPSAAASHARRFCFGPGRFQRQAAHHDPSQHYGGRVGVRCREAAQADRYLPGRRGGPGPAVERKDRSGCPEDPRQVCTDRCAARRREGTGWHPRQSNERSRCDAGHLYGVPGPHHTQTSRPGLGGLREQIRALDPTGDVMGIIGGLDESAVRALMPCAFPADVAQPPPLLPLPPC